jgi:hypothetical protein
MPTMSSNGEVEVEEDASVSTGNMMNIEGEVDEDLDSISLTTFDVWALGITIVIGGQYFAWNAGLSAGFGTFLVATVLIALAYVSLISCIAELSGAFPFAGECHMSHALCRHVAPFDTPPPPTTHTPPSYTHRHLPFDTPPPPPHAANHTHTATTHTPPSLLPPASCILHPRLS